MTDDTSPTTHGDDDNALEFAAPVNLQSLHPARDVARFDATIRSIAIAAAAERRRLVALRSAPGRWGGALSTVGGWSRPAFAAAMLVIVAGAATLLLAPTPASAAPQSLAESAGIPAPLAEWSTTSRAPSATDLLDFFDVTRTPRGAATAR